MDLEIKMKQHWKIVVLISLAGLLGACQDQSGPATKEDATEKATQNTTEKFTDKTSEETKEGTATIMAETQTNPMVIIETSMGTIKAKLWADKTPVTVANFLSYADKGYYDGLIFHRVIEGFMIQGGGFGADMAQKPTDKPIKNEAATGKPNDKGTLAMARTGVVDSATSQFFINLANNDFLNHKSTNPQEFGYCAFGEVVEGIEVVEAIGQVKTHSAAGHDDVPVDAVKIESIRRAE